MLVSTAFLVFICSITSSYIALAVTLESIALLITAAGGIADLINKRGDGLEFFNSFITRKLSDSIPNFTELITEENPYTNRLALENELRSVRDRNTTAGEYYFVVVGPQGAGKSALISQIFNTRGTVVVSIHQLVTPESIVSKIFAACGITSDAKGVEIEALLEPLKRARIAKSSPMNIVIEMNRGGADSATLMAIKSVCRTLATAATVVLVLSETNGALEYGTGTEPRKKIIWVDSMTSKEAFHYARSIGISATDEQLQHYFKTVGTLPIQIRNLKTDLFMGHSIDDIICDAIKNSIASLRSFPLTKIRNALKVSPNGVKVENFDGEKEDGIWLASPKQVAPHMVDAIMYHFPSDEYRLTTNALKTALMLFHGPYDKEQCSQDGTCLALANCARLQVASL
jgi:hypothetical protein